MRSLKWPLKPTKCVSLVGEMAQDDDWRASALLTRQTCGGSGGT